MNKKPYYRQTAIIFCILSVVFIVVGLSLVLRNDSILMIEIPLIASVMIYAIVSSVRINKGGKNELGIEGEAGFSDGGPKASVKVSAKHTE